MTHAARTTLRWAIVAFALTLAYAAYLQPDWESYRDDQFEYLAVARGVVARGEYTRAAVGEHFFPEPLRTPGYPLFLAGLCATVGCDHWHVAVAQGVMMSMLVAVTAFVAARIDPALRAPTAAAVALYLPFPYFAAITLSETITTVSVAAAGASFLVARRTRSAAWGAAFGAATAWAGLARPIFLTLPAAFGLALLLAAPRDLGAARRAWIAAAVAFAVIVAPVAAYSVAAFGTPTSSGGTGLWWGYFQGLGGSSGAVERFNEVSARGDEHEVVRVGAELGLDPVEATEAAAAKRAIARYMAVVDRHEQAYAWVALNRELASRASTLIAHDPAGWLVRGIAVREVVLWGGEVPARVRDVMRGPVEVTAAVLAFHIALTVVAVVGLVALIRAGRREAWLPLVVVAYTAAASFPFVTEARYALPAQPFLLIGAAAGASRLMRKTAHATTGVPVDAQGASAPRTPSGPSGGSGGT